MSRPIEERTHAISFADDPGLTEQHHLESTDIRVIMRKAAKTGMISHLAQHEGKYMDLANRPDFQEAQNVIAEANSVFETVPAKIREKFHNDPAEFVEFMQNSNNRDEMLELGFTDSHLPARTAEPEPAPAEPAEPAEPAPAPS